MTLKPTLLLLPLSWLYRLGVAGRNWLFDREVLTAATVDVPVISVGNISAGGTGKTPFVEMVAGMLKDAGVRPAVLSRGYGRASRGYQVVSNGRQRCAEAFTAGDEPAQMAEKLEGVIVVVDEDRVNGARTLIRDFHPEVIVLDDGFQHRHLARDLDIVLVTADEVLQGSWMLPAGRRREPWSSLHRADVVAMTKCRSPEQFDDAMQALTRRAAKPTVGVRTVVRSVRKAGSRSSDDVNQRSVLAVSGIADPLSLERTLTDLGCRIVGHRVYPDHHWYSDGDLDDIATEARKSGAEKVVTTEKDEARLLGLAGFQKFAGATSCVVVEIGAEVFSGGQILEELLRSVMKTEGNT